VNFSFKISKYVFAPIWLLTAIYLLLELFYKYFISAKYFYMGYTWEPNYLKWTISKFFFIWFILFFNYMQKRSSFLFGIYLVLLFFFYIPNAVLFALGNFPYAPFLSNVFFVSCFLLSPLIKFNVPKVLTPEKFRALVMFIVPAVCIIPIIITFRSDININTLLLREIYSTREVFSAKIAGVNNYLYNFLAKTFIPIGLIYFLIHRKHFLVAGMAALLLYLFLISGNKLVYLTTLILVLFYIAGKTYEQKTSRFLFLIIIAFISFPLLDYTYLPEPVLTGTFVNRFLFIPALLTQDYFDFFAGKPLLFAETHFLNFFAASPYNKPVGFLISELYFNAPDSFANNGIVSDGFMNLGYWGVAIFSLFFTSLFALFNSFKIHPGFFGVFFSYIYIMLSAPLFTCLITGGVLIFVVYCFTLLGSDKRVIE
jgi:hypothetical protein